MLPNYGFVCNAFLRYFASHRMFALAKRILKFKIYIHSSLFYPYTLIYNINNYSIWLLLKVNNYQNTFLVIF